MIRIILTVGQVDRAYKFAGAVCRSYAGRKKESSRRLAFNKIDKNIAEQAAGRMAEMALCGLIELEEREALDWNTGATDRGHDLTAGGYTIDVKASTNPRATRLIWPVTKRHFFDKAAADIFVFAKVTEPAVDLIGCVARGRFFREKRISTGKDGLIRGTWYMPEIELSDLHKLQDVISVKSEK